MEKSSTAQNDGTNMDEIGTSLDLTKIEEGKNLLPPSGVPRETREIREPRKLLVDQIPSKKVPLAVEWINLSYSASEFSYYYYYYDFIFTRNKQPKLILHPMSGRIFPGEMLAIMGNSGAGKSTLLQILAGRIISENLTGQILINGKSVNFSTFRKHSGYVMQHDALIPFLTVKETIYYAAHLSIQQKTYIERETAAEAIIQLLRLQNVQDTIIGDKLNKGLTRGEKRRVSIAVDIVHEPPVIFLDEPTSGLDAIEATCVIEALKGIALKRNSALIVSIKQPSAKQFGMFDKCIFLSDGVVTYSGPTAGLKEYTSRLYVRANMGPCPVSNPPEVFLELCEALLYQKNLELTIIDTAQKIPNSEGAVALIVSDDYITANNFFYETYLLFMRNVRFIPRTKELLVARFAAPLWFGVIIGSLFYNRPSTDTGLTQKTAYFVFTISFFSFTTLEALPVFLKERDVFEREYSRAAYRASSYVVATTLAYIPFQFVPGLLLACSSYFLVVLPNRADAFLFHVLIYFLVNIAAQAGVVLVTIIVRDKRGGQSLGSGVFTVMFLISGFFITKNDIPDWWSWLNYLSQFKYAYESLIINAFAGDVTTPTSTNAQLMVRFSTAGISKWRGVGVIIGLAVTYRIISYYLLMIFYNGRRRH